MNRLLTPRLNRKTLRYKMNIENLKILMYEKLACLLWDLAFYLDLQGVRFKNKTLACASKKRTYLSLIDKLDIYEHRRAFKRAIMSNNTSDLYPLDVKEQLWAKK